MKILKTFSYNLFFFIFFIFIIEILFGYWFDKNNLGPYMREHRMKKNDYTLKIDGQKFNYTYERNYYGFIGKEIRLKDIKGIFIGGSTADERYKPEKFSIVGNLNKKFSDKKIKFKIINAGIEGQSTIGHINNFKVWFPKLESFNPKVIIFYVGINDHLSPIEQMSKNIDRDGLVKNPKKSEIIKDYLKSSSIFYDLLRKTKHKYHKSDKARIVYDFNNTSASFYKNRNFNFLNYDKALLSFNVKNILKIHENRIKYYLKNIDELYLLSKNIGAEPIFINQLTSDGSNNKSLFALNYSLIQHCKSKGYNCVDLAKKLNGKREYWWDGIHTTIEGSKKISELIFPELLDFILENGI